MPTNSTTETASITVTGTNVCEVADAIWQTVIDIYQFYARHFPYDLKTLRMDLGQILLWEMANSIKVQFYEVSASTKIERLSYEFVPQAAPGAATTPPGEFPRFAISESLQVRLIAVDTTRKPEAQVREFYDQLGWHPCEALTRTGQGSTQQYGAFASGGINASCEVYTDLPDTTQRDRKERGV